jgi:hypothetical protein
MMCFLNKSIIKEILVWLISTAVIFGCISIIYDFKSITEKYLLFAGITIPIKVWTKNLFVVKKNLKIPVKIKRLFFNIFGIQENAPVSISNYSRNHCLGISWLFAVCFPFLYII